MAVKLVCVLLVVMATVSGHQTRHSKTLRTMYRTVTTTTAAPEDYDGNSLWGDETTSAPDSLDAGWARLLDIAKGRAKPTPAPEEDEEEDEDEDDLEDGMDSEESDSQADSGSSYSVPHRQSDMTEYKWKTMGSRSAVDDMFNQYKFGLLKSNSASDNLEVYRHHQRVTLEGYCRVPKPRVIRVSDVYPSTTKIYVPSCTILHQCGDDTGCCPGSGQKCMAKTTKMVELYFSITNIHTYFGRQTTYTVVDKLRFYNQTECECRDVMKDLMPRDSGLNGEYDMSTQPMCKCPSIYTVRYLANGSCSCDCFDKQKDCIKYKKGKEYFNHEDRLCIEMNTCQLPNCDFGVYLRTSGRCPRKHEKLRRWSRSH